jgi:hypothetical protein
MGSDAAGRRTTGPGGSGKIEGAETRRQVGGGGAGGVVVCDPWSAHVVCVGLSLVCVKKSGKGKGGDRSANATG